MKIQGDLSSDSLKSFGRVLLVEDDPSHAHLIRRFLRDYCEEVVHVACLRDARRKMVEAEPQLIVTDLHVPDAGGAQTVKELRALRPSIPIIVLTSSTSLEFAVDAMKLGARDFMVKDFGPNFKEILGLSISRVQAALLIEAERARMLREMQMLRTAVENGIDGIGIYRDDQTLVYSNSAFREFINMCGGQADLLNKLFASPVVHAERLLETLIEKFRSLASGAVWNTQVAFNEEGSRTFELSLSIVDFTSSASVADLVESCREGVIWVRDRTEQQRRERFQRDLISTTTHDLKGPLGAIFLSTELLTPLVEPDSKAGQLVLRVASAAQGAIHLIDEFLSARRIQEGTLLLKPTLHPVGDTVRQVVESFESMSLAKRQRVTLDCPEQGIEWKLDALGLSRVVTNLLNNAIKFTPKGGAIGVHVSKLDGDLHIAVTDTGSGIEPSEVQRIFERFSRLDKHSQIPGSGLGLFIVKSIVAAHGGRIEVTSQPGKGTTFELIFPENLPENQHGELVCLELT